jgi:hypothetical protein
MLPEFRSATRIFAQVLELDQQERDAREQLAAPEPKPGLHKQLRRLIVRIAKDRAELEQAIANQVGTKPSRV